MLGEQASEQMAYPRPTLTESFEKGDVRDVSQTVRGS